MPYLVNTKYVTVLFLKIHGNHQSNLNITMFICVISCIDIYLTKDKSMLLFGIFNFLIQFYIFSAPAAQTTTGI